MSDSINYIKTHFPHIKLSYETIIHKKVLNSQFIVIIPKGKKCFLWFYMFNNKPTCFIVEKHNNNNIFIKITSCCFSKKLAYNTILYGTLFNNNNVNFFSVEDIYYFKGEEINNHSWYNKLHIFKDLFSNYLQPVNYNNKFISIGLSTICNKNEDVNTIISKLPYKIDSLQFKLFSKINSYLSLDIKKFKMENGTFTNPSIKAAIFSINADIQNDIYNLFISNQNKLEFIGIAGIPTYKNSVMMNTLFRTIKENNNLDALEESDDETEFQNHNVDKYVNVDKYINMKCLFNKKCKKWVPVEISNEPVTTSEDFLINLTYNISI
jgi:hypothetical protein